MLFFYIEKRRYKIVHISMLMPIIKGYMIQLCNEFGARMRHLPSQTAKLIKRNYAFVMWYGVHA